MFFTVGKIQKQLKEIKASIHRERCDISHFKYIEGDDPDPQAHAFDDRSWDDFLSVDCGVAMTKLPGWIQLN